MRHFTHRSLPTAFAQAASPTPPRRLARWLTLIAATGLCAAAVAVWSGSDRYEDRLIDLAARQSLTQDVYAAADATGSSEIKALLIDVAADRELATKMQWALTKYKDAGLRVLKTYGNEPLLQEVLRRYGENVVPVIVFFMDHDVATLRASYGVRRLWARWHPPVDEPTTYGPEVRGLYAIQRIQSDGHHFLGQFDVGQGIVRWNQTDRVLKSLEEFLAGGVRDLETRHNTGASLRMADVAWAGADVLAMTGVVKALKFVKGAAGVTAAVGKEVGIVQRTTLFGHRVLQNSHIGRSVIKYGAKAGTAYLAATHPGLLTSLFREAGSWMGWSGWISAAVGWWVLLTVLAFLLLPLVSAVGVLVPVLHGVAQVARWLWPLGALGQFRSGPVSSDKAQR